MAENLKTTKLNDGTNISQVTYYYDWNKLSTPAYCWYDNDKKYKDAFGALYNFYTVETEKLCPTGWHVPTNDDWTTLIDYLGGDSIAGGFLKETETKHWQNPNLGATNSSGFTAIASGRRIVGLDHDKEYLGSWWSSEPCDTIEPFYLNLYKYDDFVLYNNLGGWDGKNDGLSVRCIKD